MNVDSPTFSIVIPCFNYGHYLVGAIDSVIDQEFNDVEIIVVDDASTDTTPEVVAAYGSGIIYKRLQNNLGAGGAWAQGLALATGRFVCKLDADDEQKNGFLDAVYDAFTNNRNIGLVATSSLVLLENGQKIEDRIAEQDMILGAKELRGRLLEEFFFRMPGTSIRRDILLGHEPPDPRLYQIHDWEYLLRVLEGYSACLIAKPLAIYRIHDASITRTARTGNRLENDFDTWLSMTNNKQSYLSPSERSMLAGSMGVLLMRGTPLPTTPENLRRAIHNFRAARQLAEIGGDDQVRRLNKFIAMRVKSNTKKVAAVPGKILRRLLRWAGYRIQRGAEIYNKGGRNAALLFYKEELKNTWLTLNKNRAFKNINVSCNLCGWKGPRFHTFCGAGYIVNNCTCPQCGSFPRHRGFAAILDRFLSEDLKMLRNNPGLRLIFAPENSMHSLLSKYLDGLRGVDYDSINELVDVRMDIQQMALPDNSVGFLSCFHVIEHVPDDRAALREFNRILDPSGSAIICVPINFDLSETIEFGRPNELLEDHYYDYSPDFGERVAEAGFSGTVYRLSEVVSAEEYITLSLQDELIFWVQKDTCSQVHRILNSASFKPALKRDGQSSQD